MTRIRLFQAFLLAVGVVALGTVGWHLSQFRAARKRAAPPPSSPATRLPATATPRAAANTGIDVRVVRTIGSDRQFTLQAPRLDEKDGEKLLSGGVLAQGQGKDGFSYTIVSDSARGDRDWLHVVLTGNVRIRRSDGLTIWADSAEHFEKEQSDLLRGNVRIESRGMILSCERAEYKSESQELFLDGNVRGSDPPAVGRPARALHAEHLYYARSRDEAVLRDGVRLVQGSVALIGDRVDLELVDGRLRSARLRGHPGREILVESWAVGDCVEQGAAVPLRLLRLKALEIGFDSEGEPERALPADADTALQGEGLNGPHQLWSFRSRSFAAKLGPGPRLNELKLDGPVEWEERPGPAGGNDAALRTPELTARFLAAGAIDEALFPAGLDLRRGSEQSLRGGRGRFRAGRLEVSQSPRLQARDTLLRARRIELLTEAQGVTATEEVHSETQTRPSPAGSGLTRSTEPFHVRAEAMDLLDGGRVARYRGSARAWQGASVLEADEIRVDTTLEGLEADGRVRALLADDAGSRRSASAERLSWREQQIDLRGNARIESADLTMSAGQIVIQLDDDGRRVEAIEGIGSVSAIRKGIRASAERLRHEIASEETTLLSGARMVHVTAADGNETWGDRIVLVSRGDRVVVGSGGEGVARTRINAASGGAR